MGPIRPGGEISRRFPRSSTTGNLDQRQTGFGQVRSALRGNPPSFMRETTSSFARRGSAANKSSVPVPTDSRHLSVGQPARLDLDEPSTEGHRLSSSNSSRALRANIASDLPFREMYNPGQETNQVAQGPPRFMEKDDLPTDDPRRESIPEGITPLREARQYATTHIDPELGFAFRQYPKKEGAPPEAKSPEWLITPTTESGEAEEKVGEASFHGAPGNTPLNLLGIKHEIYPAVGFDMSELRLNAVDDQHDEYGTLDYETEESGTRRGKQRERVGLDQGESSTKHGKQRESQGSNNGGSFATHNKQHESMGYYDEEGYTAPTKQRQSMESTEGDTIIRSGKGDTDTDSMRSILMRANTAASMPVEEDEEDDPRNVSAIPLPPVLLSLFLHLLASPTLPKTLPYGVN